MRVAVLLSAVLVSMFVANARATDRITYAFGGPAHRVVDTFNDAMPVDRFLTPEILGEVVCEQSHVQRPDGPDVGIGVAEPFLREPAPRESLFKSGELFLFNVPPSVSEGPAGAEPERIRGAFDGILLAN